MPLSTHLPQIKRLLLRLARPFWLLIAALSLVVLLSGIPNLIMDIRYFTGWDLKYNQQAQNYTVIWLFPAGPAARQGIQVGDEVALRGSTAAKPGQPFLIAAADLGQPLLVIVRSPDGSTRELTIQPSLNWYDLLIIILLVSSGLAYAVTGATIFWRGSGEVMAWLVSLFCFTWGVASAVGSAPELEKLHTFLFAGLAIPLLFVMLATFPDGRFVPRRAWVLVAAGMAANLIALYASQFLDPTPNWPSNLLLVLLAVGLGAQIYRYRRVASVVQRQQTRWVVIGLVALFAQQLLGFVLYYSDYEAWAGIYWLLPLVVFLVNAVLGVLPPLTLAISVLRYRLWDMRFALNRALVYGALTACLGLLGVVGVQLINYLLNRLLAPNSPMLAVILAALPLAAVFKPLQTRLQTWVDRSFKPEEIDLAGGFLEFSPEVNSLLEPDELLRILALQVRRQLHAASAAVYLCDETGRFTRAEPPLDGARQAGMAALPASLEPSVGQLARLEAGAVVTVSSPETAEGQPAPLWAVWAPLVVSRALEPDLIGVLAVGPRLTGKGYSTLLLQGLQALGVQAGRTIYVAQLRRRSSHNPLAHLDHLERRLAEQAAAAGLAAAPPAAPDGPH